MELLSISSHIPGHLQVFPQEVHKDTFPFISKIYLLLSSVLEPHFLDPSYLILFALLNFYLFIYFWLSWVACRMLVHQPRIEPGPWQCKYQFLTTRLPGNPQNISFGNFQRHMSFYRMFVQSGKKSMLLTDPNILHFSNKKSKADKHMFGN